MITMYSPCKENVRLSMKKMTRTERKEKKTYTTPLKEKAKREKALKKAEEKVAFLEAKIEELKAELSAPENLSDYVKLSALGEELDALEEELLNALDEWEKLAE